MSKGKSIKTKAHEHMLTYMDSVKHYLGKGLAGWTCDACLRTSKDLQENYSYHCTKMCDFDLCKDCPKTLKSSKHEHPLRVTLASEVYGSQGWACDNCRVEGSEEGNYSWHCKEGCHFDLCYGCTKKHRSSAHSHSLEKINPSKLYPKVEGWSCDICRTSYNHTNNGVKPYNCRKCHFDLCKDCMKATVIIESGVEEMQEKVKNNLSVTDGNENVSSKKTVPDVFISYQWDNQANVKKLKKKLEASNINCWMDIGMMGGGDELKTEIDKGLRGCKLVISCVTGPYTKSSNCQQEVALADALKKPILPLLFESVAWPPEGPMAMPFAPLLYVDCCDGLKTEKLDTLVSIVQSRIKKCSK